MTQYLNYRVNLQLKDGSNPSGLITRVSNDSITLRDATDAHKHPIPDLNILSTQIADLKVIKLPADFYKSNKKNKEREKKHSSSEPETSNSIIVEDSNNKIKIKQNQDNDPDWDNESSKVSNLTDFDFAANLKMFDKSSVFADFKKKDTVNPHDRLVGHNKLENVLKVAKSKKDKYDIDEMVLDSNKKDNWDNIGNATRRQSKVERSKSPNPLKDGPNSSSTNLKFVDSLSLNPIPLASPVQMLEIERLSSISFGLSSNLITEIAATNLSQLITSKILGGSTRLSNKKNHNLPPLVLLLIGSSRVASRNFATGRHLTNHGVRVLAYVLNEEILDDTNEEDIDHQLSVQLHLFESCGGKVITGEFNQVLDIINNQLDTPVELIIDGLQGYDDHLDDIFYEDIDSKNLNHVIKWCHESSQINKIMSLEVPSGLDGGSGILTSDTLHIKCRWLISFGIPITGLLLAYKNGQLDVENDDITHYLIDIGIPNKVYQAKSNLRKFDKFWYSAESIIKIDVTD